MLESQLHKQVAQYLRATLPGDVAWTTIGHGGGGKARGAQLKAMGLARGWPDIVFLWHGRLCCIELKAAKGKLSLDQVAMHERLTLGGAVVRVCKTVREVEDFLIVCGVDLRGRLAA